jgi:hypothetical protein
MLYVKKRFLVCYDYGMGGLWGFLSAKSEKDIRRLYPELTVFINRPSWMSDDQYHRIEQRQPYDIDEVPRGMLKTVVGDRNQT